jgi:hypothetical protein
MVMRFSVEQKPRALVNDDQFPALAITRNSRDHTKVAQSREFRQIGRAEPAQSYITPSGNRTRTQLKFSSESDVTSQSPVVVMAGTTLKPILNSLHSLQPPWMETSGANQTLEATKGRRPH